MKTKMQEYNSFFSKEELRFIVENYRCELKIISRERAKLNAIRHSNIVGG